MTNAVPMNGGDLMALPVRDHGRPIAQHFPFVNGMCCAAAIPADETTWFVWRYEDGALFRTTEDMWPGVRAALARDTTCREEVIPIRIWTKPESL